MAGTILVIGATGNVGSGLVAALSATNASVRALAHSETKAQELRARGVEAVVADLNRAETLDAAIHGVDKIYLITWNGPTAVQQVDNVLAAAKRSGTPHIVRQGAFGPEQSRLIVDHLEAETHIKESGLPWTIVAPTFFTQNLMMAAPTIASDGMMYFPMKGGKLAMVDVRDIVDTAFTVLTGKGHEGKKYVLTGPAGVSFGEVAATLSGALGKTVTYVDVPGAAAKQSMVGMGMPEWIADGYIELFEGFSRGYASKVSPDVEKVTGHAGRSVQQFAQDFAPYFGVPVGV